MSMDLKVLKSEYRNNRLMLIVKLEINLKADMNTPLTEMERNILELILQNDNMTQKDLGKIYGNVKVHRILQKLENRGLIKRRKNGRTYIITPI